MNTNFNLLASYNGMLWLAEPSGPHGLNAVASKVASYERCFTPREVAIERMQMFDLAAKLPLLASESTGDTLESEMQLAAPAKQIRAVKGKVGTIPVMGAIEQRTSSELMKAGGTSCEYIGAALDAMLANAAIGGIVLEVDSPGGTIGGVMELADKIFNARSKKPIYCMANSLCASALYWIGSAASMFCCTDGGQVGSIGVYMMHIDQSKALEQAGITATLITSGEHKAETIGVKPLSDATRAHLQEEADALHETFIDAVRRNRDTTSADVRANYGKGRVLRADQALARGMIDRVMTMEQLMDRLTGGGPAAQSSQAAASVEMLRVRNAQIRARLVA